MKLELTLPERPGFLHAIPLFNLFALLLMFLVLGPSMVLQSGVSVELPPSRFQMDRFRDAQVVTLGPGSPARIHFGREATTLDGLNRLLEETRKGDSTGSILLHTDVGTPVGAEREVSELILKKGFRLLMVGRPVQAGDPAPGKEAER